jgi:hypothetical protein|tara:strand:+ start:361 stop:2562 length:2202 start_codon:yes stop_codon:yes gene_type:complete
MALAKVQLIPGFDKQVTETGAEGRWTGGQYVRFRYGLPEKVGGWAQLGADSLVGVARDQHTWFDLSGNRYAAVGTDKILYIYYEGSFYDIHPLNDSLKQTGMTNCFTTSSASNVVTVTCTGSHGLSVGDLVVFSSVSAIPGTSSFVDSDFEKTFEVKTTPTTTTFTIQMPSNETGTPFSTTGTATLEVYYVVGPAFQLPGYGWSTGQWGGTTTTATTTINNSGTFPSGASTVVLASSASMPATGTLLIGSGSTAELITYTSNNTATNTISGISRGQGGTSDVTHADGSTVQDASSYTGWGSATAAGVIIDPGQWKLTNYGQKLIALIYNSVVVEWDPSAAGALSNPNRATLISGAPTASRDMLVSTPDRHLCFFGTETTIGTTSSQDDMFIRFSDQEDINDYTPTATNTAGTQRLADGSKIIGTLRGRNGNYIWTDTAMFTMRFIGAPFTFGFEQVGTNCGLIAQHAAIEVDGIIYWMSEDSFFYFDGASVKKLPCLVEDYVFGDINNNAELIVHAGVNDKFNEITWFYPSDSETSVDRSVTYNTRDSQNIPGGVWTTNDGSLMKRTTWVDQGVYGKPYATAYNSSETPTQGSISGISAGATTYYEHETGNDQVKTDGTTTAIPAQIESGDFDIDKDGSGEYMMRISRFIPDFKNQTGDAQVTIFLRDFPSDTRSSSASGPLITGPFTVTTSTKQVFCRSRGRAASFKIANTGTGQTWRFGTFRADIQVGGRR